LSSILGQLLSNKLDLIGTNVVEADKNDLIVLIEEFEALLDGDLLLISGFDRVSDHDLCGYKNTN
jgi:hypothetical protein